MRHCAMISSRKGSTPNWTTLVNHHRTVGLQSQCNEVSPIYTEVTLQTNSYISHLDTGTQEYIVPIEIRQMLLFPCSEKKGGWFVGPRGAQNAPRPFGRLTPEWIHSHIPALCVPTTRAECAPIAMHACICGFPPEIAIILSIYCQYLKLDTFLCVFLTICRETCT